MLEQLDRLSEPLWLTSLTPQTMAQNPLPLHEILSDSLYYPSSCFDGDPVKYLAGNFFSFIYVDYGYTREELNDTLNNPGFLGYEVLTTKEVKKEELIPKGWRQSIPTEADGDPALRKDWIKEPFCTWVIMQRKQDRSESHGPKRFSLLYLCEDGLAAFQALYTSNSAKPKAVAIIQPGHGFGGNWTDFTDPTKIFARSVLGNPAGHPEMLLFGGDEKCEYYREPCWPSYSHNVCFLDKAGGGSIGVWQRSATAIVLSV